MTKDEVYYLFKRINKHFNTTNFSYFNKSDKIHIKLKTDSREAPVCHILSVLPKSELVGLCISHQLKDRKQLFDLVKPEAKTIYEDWKLRITNKPLLFYKELQTFSNKQLVFSVENLVNEYYKSNISLETLVGLYQCTFPFSLDHVDCIVSTISRKIIKYNPFLSFDVQQLQLILKRLKLQESVDETTTEFIESPSTSSQSWGVT